MSENITELGRAVRHMVDYEIGQRICQEGKGLVECANYAQRSGWWSYLNEEAMSRLTPEIQRRLGVGGYEIDFIER